MYDNVAGFYRPMSVAAVSDIMEAAINEQIESLLVGGDGPDSDARDLKTLAQIRGMKLLKAKVISQLEIERKNEYS